MGVAKRMQPVCHALSNFSDEANCATCTRKGGPCPRSETKRYPNGYVVSGVTRAVSGIIYKCPHYTGPYEVKSIYAIEAEFDTWISGVKKTPKTMKAVVYDQYGHDAWPVMGTREEILGQYHFYRDCYPEKSLGLASEEYYKHKQKSLL